MKKFITVFSLILIAMSSTAKAVSLDEVLKARNILYSRGSNISNQDAYAITALNNTVSDMRTAMWNGDRFEKSGNYPYLAQAEQVKLQALENYKQFQLDKSLGEHVDEKAFYSAISKSALKEKQLEDAYIRAVLLDIKAKNY